VFYDIEPTYREAMAVATRLYEPEFSRQALQDDPAGVFTIERPWPDIEVALIRLITQTYLLQNGIAQGDRLSMAWSVELRLPLVDYRLIELVVGLTKSRPSVSGGAKTWLREAVRDVMPGFVMARRKRGFSPPWRQWRGALNDAYGAQLMDGYLRQQGALSADGAAWVRHRMTPPAWRLPSNMAERVVMLEMWGRGIASASPAAVAPAVSRRAVGAAS
jgi:asparagine synthase (glutamine-hydrolysing)